MHSILNLYGARYYYWLSNDINYMCNIPFTGRSSAFRGLDKNSMNILIGIGKIMRKLVFFLLVGFPSS